MLNRGSLPAMLKRDLMEDISADAAFAAWRTRAAGILTFANTMVFLPVVLIVAAGQGPPLTLFTKISVYLFYGAILSNVLFWKRQPEIRIGINLAVGYLIAFVVGIALPQGPFIKTLPLVLPLIAMVFFEKKAGYGAALLSAAMLFVSPLLSTLSFLSGILVDPSIYKPSVPPFVWFQAVAQTAILLQLMLLLNQFHNLLKQTLTERARASQNLTDEMQKRLVLEQELARHADEERRRLGCEIHDGICQMITASLLRAEALAGQLEPMDAAVEKSLRGITSLLEESLNEAHVVAQGLCPLQPGPDALPSALRRLAGRIQSTAGIDCILQCSDNADPGDSTKENHLFRIAQEAVSNAVKHARAGTILISLTGDRHFIELRIEDDGVGLSDAGTHEGMGLQTMSYRAHLMEGELTAASIETGGTRILCRVPRYLQPKSGFTKEQAAS